MTNIVYRIRRSDHIAARMMRRAYRGVVGFSLPAPRALVKPVTAAVLMLNRAVQWAQRVVLCEPYLKARCHAHGRGIRTGCFFHYITGPGRVILGDRVRMDGKSSIMFAAVLPETPEPGRGHARP